MDDRGEFAVPPAKRPGLLLIGVYLRVRQVALKLRVLSREVGKPFQLAYLLGVLSAMAGVRPARQSRPVSAAHANAPCAPGQ
ncbi:MAG: hypothetical protein ACTHKL_15560 [Streptosporangiaceae bacterium]